MLLAAFANIFLQLPALMLTVSVLAIVIFSAYMLFDVQRVVNGGETNYITRHARDLPRPVQRVHRTCWRCSASSAATATKPDSGRSVPERAPVERKSP